MKRLIVSAILSIQLDSLSSMSVTTAIVLAGGLGTSLRATVPDLPKPMAPINGRPFLEYQMDYWINQGINHFVLSVGYLQNIIIDHFGDSYRGITIEYAKEHQPLGTGGGLLMASERLTTPFLAINGDTFIEVDLVDLYNFHVFKNSNWTFSLFRTIQSDRYMSMDVSTSGEILSLESNKDRPNGLANGGVYLINPGILQSLGYKIGSKASLECELLPSYVSQYGNPYGKEFEGSFIDIGLPEDYHRSSEIIK